MYGLALLAALSTAGAHAASFDCRQAKTPVEQALCHSAELSALDERMAQSYQRALAALSPAGATALRTSQRAWLRYVPKVCPPTGPAGARTANEQCLGREWQQRLQALDQAGLKLGALVLNRVDDYDAHRGPAGDDTGSPSGVVTHHVAHLSIDAPASPAALQWNRSQTPPEPPPEPRDSPDDATADIDVSIEIGCASERLLSLETTSYQYSHGAAHGMYATQVSTVLLQAGLRPLLASDLFAPGSGWQQKLPQLFWQHYQQTPEASADAEVRQLIRTVAADASRWLITPAGLRISFSAYEGGSYAGTPGPITVAWSSLAPLLSDKAAPSCQFSSLKQA